MRNSSKKNKQISQRWEAEFQKEVKQAAKIYGTSMTKLTIEALDIFLTLADYNQFVKMTPDKRKRVILEAATQRLENIENNELKEKSIDTEGIENIGLIRDQVEHLLVKNPDYHFSTNEISDVLNIPQSTARTYVRQIGEEDKRNFVLVRGRPNKIYYSSNY